ncbi:hypothetical protein [Brevundimonas lenta]|uniref:Uncharacterized protein n=1 Tax=Brevundimonas lenta TaxID=424796 RepID=A0A7W6JDK7_9CAUL|nr:hypothetical protein [Brevundimonas lenta]MBB4083096.1 hypothetical protein [Brevundimonas lenta]
MSPDDLESAFSLLMLDTLFLRGKSEGFFLKFEDACRRIQSGELTHYGPSTLAASGFAEYLEKCSHDGTVTPDVKAAAQRFLDFLEANPGHWPLR